MEYDHMIEALATNGSNHSLYIGSLPRRARCRQNFRDAHVSHLFSEVIAKGPIAVPQQVTGVGQREMPPAVAVPSTPRSGGRSHWSRRSGLARGTKQKFALRSNHRVPSATVSCAAQKRVDKPGLYVYIHVL
jgi:hypothetical protein